MSRRHMPESSGTTDDLVVQTCISWCDAERASIHLGLVQSWLCRTIRQLFRKYVDLVKLVIKAGRVEERSEIKACGADD